MIGEYLVAEASDTMFNRQCRLVVVALEVLNRHFTSEACPRELTPRSMLRRHTEPGVACNCILSAALGITVFGVQLPRDVDVLSRANLMEKRSDWPKALDH